MATATTIMVSKPVPTFEKPEFADLLAAAKAAAKDVQAAVRTKRGDAGYRVTVDAIVDYTGICRETGEEFDDSKWIAPGSIKPGHKPWGVRFRDNRGDDSDAMEGLDDVERVAADWRG